MFSYNKKEYIHQNAKLACLHTNNTHASNIVQSFILKSKQFSYKHSVSLRVSPFIAPFTPFLCRINKVSFACVLDEINYTTAKVKRHTAAGGIYIWGIPRQNDKKMP